MGMIQQSMNTIPAHPVISQLNLTADEDYIVLAIENFILVMIMKF